ncbi:DUF222 domain-containing protein, partial [Desertimonas flava]|uniref:DUF222 domain-containing protein n=1 Tax=Desertimonas flava TaxID=2064846 RepID=UPI000E342231
MASGNRPDLDQLHAAVDALGTAFADLAVETFTTDTLKHASIEVTRAANMIDGIRADLARKERDLRPPAGTIPPPPSRSLDPRGHRPHRQPERDSARSDLFDQLPALGDATRRGDLSGAYADTVTQAVARLSPDERTAFYQRYRNDLTTHALGNDLHSFRVHVRGLVDDFDRARDLERFQQQRANRTANTWTDHATGMTNLFAKFDPETGARVRAAIDQEIDRLYRAKRDDPTDTRTHQQVVADAIANLITGTRTNNQHATDLVVLIDLQTLLDHDATPTPPTRPATKTTAATPAATPSASPANLGRCCETSDGTPLPVETIRRLACNAGIIPAVLNSHGVILDLGRTRRLATNDQRQALRTMYPTCAFNDCTTP